MTPSLKLEDCLRTPDGQTRRDIATLLKFRDGVDTYNPIYLFWDLYRPQTDIGLDLSPAPVSWDGGEVQFTSYPAEDFGVQSPALPLSGESEALVLEMLERLQRQNRTPYEPDGESSDFREFREEIESYDDCGVLPFPETFKRLIVYLHVAAARAFRIKQSAGYSEEYLDCLREVQQARERLDLAKGLHLDIEDYMHTYLSVQHSAVAVSAIAFVELARASRREGRYAKALHYYARALDDYGSAVFISGQEGCDDAWPALNPGERRESRVYSFLQEGVHDLTIREMASTFQALMESARSDEYSWSQITDDCNSLLGATLEMFGERYDRETEKLANEFIEAGPDGEDLAMGVWLSWTDYWSWAKGRSEYQLTPGEYRKMRETDEKNAAENRLRNYFFREHWKSLPDKVKERLITADVNWNSPQRMSREAILNDLLRAMEAMCYEFIWQPLSRSKSAYEEFQRYEDRVAQRPIGSYPRVRDYVDVSEDDRFFPDFCTSRGLGQDDEKFMVESLPIALRQLVDRRNPAEHETGGTMPREVVDDCYRTFLGIGQRGVLPELARIGRKLRGGRRDRR